MKTAGSFISEVYRDGRTYFFEATFSALQWSATLWDAEGVPHGCIACSSPANRLQGEALEDAVCEWVHRAVLHEVGVVLDAGHAGLQPLPIRRPTAHDAANSERYGDREMDADEIVLVRCKATRVVAARSVELRQQAQRNMDRLVLAVRHAQVLCQRRGTEGLTRT